MQKNRFFLAVGGKYVVETFVENVGGGGGNVAVALSRLGFKVALWAELGRGSVSHVIHDKLEGEKVDLSLLEMEHDFSHVSAILLSASGERTIITHRSHHADLHFGEKVKKIIDSSRLVCVGNMPDMDISMKLEVAEYAHKRNVQVAFNFGVKDCRRGVRELRPFLDRCSYLIINRHELSDMLNIPPNELMLKDANYAHKLQLSAGSVLVVTDGELGSYAYVHSDIFHQKALHVPRVVDATGAGDAFTGGFLAAMLYKKTVQEALLIGATNSASVIQVIGAQDGLLHKSSAFTETHTLP